MKKNIFFIKKNNKIYLVIFLVLLVILFSYVISILKIKNQKFFFIEQTDNNNNYIIPDDKEGEKVKFINKKSINSFNTINETDVYVNINNINYTIQLFSDIDYNNLENYINDILEPKSEILDLNEIFIISLSSEIGVDYFVTYKNFNSKIEAQNYCKKISFINKCLIINPQN